MELYTHTEKTHAHTQACTSTLHSTSIANSKQISDIKNSGSDLFGFITKLFGGLLFYKKNKAAALNFWKKRVLGDKKTLLYAQTRVHLGEAYTTYLHVDYYIKRDYDTVTARLSFNAMLKQ